MVALLRWRQEIVCVSVCVCVHAFVLMVISFIPYIEDSVLGLISQDSGLFLKNGGRPFVRQRLSDPSSLTELHLSMSDLFLEEQSVKYTDIKGCYRQFKWDMLAGLFVSTCAGCETT